MKTLKLEQRGDDFFEDMEVDERILRHLQRVNDALLFAGGAVAMLYLLSLPRPSNLFGNVITFPLAFMLLIVAPGAYALYLLFMPSWRQVPIALRRPAIARNLSISMLTLALLPLHAILGGSPNWVFLLLLLLGGVAVLQVWQGRADGGPDSDEDLFP